MKLTYAKKILSLSLISFIVILILNIIFIYLLLTKIENINNKVEQWDISSQERLREIILKESIGSTESEREELQQYFVGAGNAETVIFTKYLEDLAKNMNVSQKKSLAEEVPANLNPDTILALKYKFNVSGSWVGVYNFLLAIENLPKLTLLNNVSLSLNGEALSAKEAKSSKKIWSADLDFSVLKLK